MSKQEPEAKYSEQIEREKLDPGEGMRPLPWVVTLLLGAMLMWGAFYIVVTPTGGLSSNGDQRTLSLLEPKTASSGASQIDGKQLYIGKCAACHQATGLGLAGVFPPLVASEWVVDSPVTLMNILLHGFQGQMTVKGVSYQGLMPAWNTLSDAEIAAVASYIRSDWGNKAAPITEDDVKKQRELTKARTAPYKNEEEIKSGT
ncbi:MAG: cytochrome c [Polynucleobacter sp.]|nr:cytochrome c [Polynucleobacter sp.]